MYSVPFLPGLSGSLVDDDVSRLYHRYDPNPKPRPGNGPVLQQGLGGLTRPERRTRQPSTVERPLITLSSHTLTTLKPIRVCLFTPWFHVTPVRSSPPDGPHRDETPGNRTHPSTCGDVGGTLVQDPTFYAPVLLLNPVPSHFSSTEPTPISPSPTCDWNSEKTERPRNPSYVFTVQATVHEVVEQGPGGNGLFVLFRLSVDRTIWSEVSQFLWFLI